MPCKESIEPGFCHQANQNRNKSVLVEVASDTTNTSVVVTGLEDPYIDRPPKRGMKFNPNSNMQKWVDFKYGTEVKRT